MAKINTDLPEYIFYYTVNQLVDKITEVPEDSEITWNSKGGSVWAGQQFMDFLNNNQNKLTANVSGIAASMGAVMLPFFDYVKGANQADVMLHSSTGGPKHTIANTNKNLYEALAKKIDEAKFKDVTGKRLKDVMLAEGDDRVDVWITGKQAKHIGLFDESYDLYERVATFDSKVDYKELGYELPKKIKEKYNLKVNTNLNDNEMEIKDVTADLLLTGNKAAYDAIFNAGKKAEQTRVSAIMKYAPYDMEKANSIVESGEPLSIEHVEHFMDKKFNGEKVAELEENGQGEIKAAKVVIKEKEAKVTVEEKEAALAELNDDLGLTKIMEDK